MVKGTSVVSGSTTYNPEPAANSCTSDSGIRQIICLADALKATLNASQLATLQRTYSVSEAKRWSTLPQPLMGDMGDSSRVGLNFGEMTTEQIQAAKVLLKAMTSTQANKGWQEVQQILNADEYLQANGAGSVYGAQNDYLAFLGTPATSCTFEIQFGGHHLALANTYKDGNLTGATPSFRGLEPFAAFSWNGSNNQPLQQEKESLQAILASFSSSQLATAKINRSFGDVVVGPQKDGQFQASPSGIKVSELSEAQKNLIITAIKTYVDDIAGTEFLLQNYLSELDQSYIAYTGSTDLANHGDYIRIDGPSVWIEYSCQNGVIYQATHPHSV